MDHTSIPDQSSTTDSRIVDVDEAHVLAIAEKKARQDQALALDLADGLMSLAVLVTENPHLARELRPALNDMGTYVLDIDVLADYARAVTRAGGTVRKDYPGPDDSPTRQFRLYGSFGPVELRMHCDRNLVCEKVVTGVETVIEEVPDPEALAAVPKITRTREVETFRYECKPILAGAAPCPCGKGPQCGCGLVGGSGELAQAGTAVAG